MKLTRSLVIVLLVGWIFAYFAFDLGHYFTLSYFKAEEAHLRDLYAQNPWQVLLVFALIYMVVAVPSLPGAALMTLAAGALFGLVVGTVLISITSVIAAILTFLSSRFLLRDFMQAKFSSSLRTVNEGVAKDGGLYLFVLRLSPIFPFFVVNVVMGLTSMPLWPFVWVTQLGVIPGSAIFVAAGTEFADLDDLSGILSLRLAFYLTLLGLLPIVTRRTIVYFQVRELYKRFAKPGSYDRNLIVIGGSVAGIVAANAASTTKARVTLIEPLQSETNIDPTGGVPSKVLAHCAKHILLAHNAAQNGLPSATAAVNFAELMARAENVFSAGLHHHRSIAADIEVISGQAQLESPFSVVVDGRRLTTRSIVLATGSHADIPSIPGLQDVEYYTPDTVLRMRTLPERILVFGGGASGCELAQCFARLGSHVIVIEEHRHLLPAEDADIAQFLLTQFSREGIEVFLNTVVREIADKAGKKVARLAIQDGSRQNSTAHSVEVDCIVLATGRRPNVGGLNLDYLGLKVSPSGTIRVNDYLQSLYPNIFACGGVAVPPEFSAEATRTAWHASFNALFPWRRLKLDYSCVPWSTATDPVIARVGYNENLARQEDIPYCLQTAELDEFSRLPVNTDSAGTAQSIFVKLLTVPKKDKIIGVCLVGPQAHGLIAEYATILRHGLDTSAQTVPEVIASSFDRARLLSPSDRHHPQPPPIWMARWMERFHAWRRGQTPAGP